LYLVHCTLSIVVDIFTLVCYDSRYMKRTAMKWMCLALAGGVLVGCQQQQMLAILKEQHVQQHTKNCLESYQRHLKWLREAKPELEAELQKASRAQWEWCVDCDGADEVPAPIRLSKEEFHELASLLKQVQSMPPLPQSVFMTEPPPFRMPGNEPWPVEAGIGCCGGVELCLYFYNSAGEWVGAWSNSEVIPASRVAEWQTRREGRPLLMMPDAAYMRLISLPSAVKAEKMDAALQKQLQHSH